MPRPRPGGPDAVAFGLPLNERAEARLTESHLRGWLKLREKTMGRVEMQIHDLMTMQFLAEDLPRQFTGRMQVRARLDDSAMRFVRA